MVVSKRWIFTGEVSERTPDLGVDEAFAGRPRNVYEFLCRTVENYPHKEALVCGDERITYGELLDRVVMVSEGLRVRCGLARGERVGLLLGNCVELPVCFFAAARIGCVSVVLNTRLSSDTLAHIIIDSAPSVLIVHELFWENVAPIRDKLASVKRIFTVPNTVGPGVRGFQELQSGLEPGVEPETIPERALCCLMYTSGTTGLPKGVMITHRNIVLNCINCHLVEDFQAEDVNLIMVPLFHATGFFGQLLLGTYVGGTSVILRAYKTEKVLELLEKERVSFIATVPTILWMMMRHPDFQRYDLSHLRKIMFGGSPSNLALIEELNRYFPQAKICEGFGMTEATVVVTLLPPEDCVRKINSVGLPMPFVEVKIVGEDDRDLPRGAVGELCVRGPTVSEGYWNNPKATRETFRSGWLHTGDLARMDEEGYIYIMGRKKEMIIRGGENVYCAEVENVLCSHPDVLEAALVGVPDEIFGEEGKAVVVPRPGKYLSEEEVLEYCRRRLATYQVPKYVVFTDALPRNPGGKVLKGMLREM